jgi:hypothetical protein
MKRYEACILSAHKDLITVRLDKAQAEGWEVSGQMLVKGSTDGALFLYIPMKRLIKKQLKAKK